MNVKFLLKQVGTVVRVGRREEKKKYSYHRPKCSNSRKQVKGKEKISNVFNNKDIF